MSLLLLTCIVSCCDPAVPSLSLPETVTMAMHLDHLTIGHRLYTHTWIRMHGHKHTIYHRVISRVYLFDELHVLGESPDAVEPHDDIKVDITLSIHLYTERTPVWGYVSTTPIMHGSHLNHSNLESGYSKKN